MSSLLPDLAELMSSNHFVQALNTPNLSTWKYLSLGFASVGIIMDIYNIVMYALFSRVYLAPSPLVERKKNGGRGGKSIFNIFGNWGQSLQEQQQF